VNSLATVQNWTATSPLILLVEDEPLVRATLTTMLDRAGFKVLAAANADEALQVLGAVPGISLVITDVQLTRSSMNGFELARKVCAEWNIDVLAISGRTHPAEDLPSRVHFLAKPILPRTLMHVVRTMIQERQGEEPTSTEELEPSSLTSADVSRVDVDKLTKRQRQVLELLIEGKNTREIAAVLNVTEYTVSTHTLALYRALGVHHRGAAVALGRSLLQRRNYREI
jgi:DNA-binding NarL/FixJ family response regulator